MAKQAETTHDAEPQPAPVEPEPAPRVQVNEGVETRLGGYVRMSIEERKQAVLELAQEGESKKAISEITGVDRGTIRRWLGGDGESTTPGAEEHASLQVVAADPDSGGESTTPAMPVGQEHADAILADIDRRVAKQAETTHDADAPRAYGADAIGDTVPNPERVRSPRVRGGRGIAELEKFTSPASARVRGGPGVSGDTPARSLPLPARTG